MASESILALLAGLADRDSRRTIAAAIAARLGAEAFLLFIRDADLGIPVPAPGFPQTLPGGPLWRALLARCEAPGCYRAEVAFPVEEQVRPALATSSPDGTIAVLVGEAPASGPWAELERALPLVGALLRAEHAALTAAAQVSVVRDAEDRARSLASALDSARAETEALYRAARDAEEGLQDANRMKDEFLVMLSHELRTPLAPIVTALQLMKLRGESGPGHEMMDRQVQHLVRLLDDLLDISRISRGKVELRKERVEVSRVVAKAVEMAGPLLEQRGHHLRVDLPSAGLFADADPVRLAQVVANLLINAAKYTDPGGHVELSVKLEDGEVVLSIRDDGIGLSSDKLSRIFEPFVQVELGAHRPQVGGLGIGLAIVKNLVSLHGGTVAVHSEGLGRGSEFVVRLPAASAGA